MKAIIILITLVIATTATSCKKDTTTICENLLGQGSADISFLEGEWEFEYFAKTTSGSKIRDKESIPSGKWISFDIINMGGDSVNIGGSICNNLKGYFSLHSANNISITVNTITYKGCGDEINELEVKLLKALNNAQCYIINENKLFLHYKSHNNKNILIFNKK